MNAMDVKWTSKQRCELARIPVKHKKFYGRQFDVFLNVMDVKRTLKQRCVLTTILVTQDIIWTSI